VKSQGKKTAEVGGRQGCRRAVVNAKTGQENNKGGGQDSWQVNAGVQQCKKAKTKVILVDLRGRDDSSHQTDKKSLRKV